MMTPQIATLRSLALSAGSRANRALALFESGVMDRETFDAINLEADAAWAASISALPQ